MIEVHRLSKSFRVHQKDPGLKGSIRSLFRRKWVEKHALKEVSLSIAPGEIVGLIGANGAGKTTLVKSLAGIIHPSSGEARVLGYHPWKRENPFRKQIALIMGQKAQLWWDLPAADCFLLLKEIYQIPEQEFNNRLKTLSSRLDVESLLTTQIRRLSLGERMKMELIAALLHHPQVVFLDEPTIGLDLTSQNAIREFLLEYREEHHPAMILTSHYMEDIERLCKRIVIIKEGEFIYDGPLKEVSSRFAQSKVVTLHLKEKPNIDLLKRTLPSSLGTILDNPHSLELKVKVPRSAIAEAASFFLSQLSVVDLSIEEEEIGTIIENIMRTGYSHED